MIFKMLLMLVLMIPLMIIQAIIFIFGGWTQDKYARTNIIFNFMDWLDI